MATEFDVLLACSVKTEEDAIECIEDALGLIEMGIRQGDRQMVIQQAMFLGRIQRPESDPDMVEALLTSADPFGRAPLGPEYGAEAVEHNSREEENDPTPRLNVPKTRLPERLLRRYDRVLQRAEAFLAA